MSDVAARIADNLAEVRGRVERAARTSGRTAGDVTLVAATKYVGDDEVRALIAAGCRDFGESRPQQLWHKAAVIGDADVRWHLIGHLQSNKARRTLPHVWLMHSLDSLRLLECLDQEAAALGRPLRALLEVNISRDANKHGLTEEEVEPLLTNMGQYPYVTVAGLMAMAAGEGGGDAARRDFARLRRLRDRLQAVSPAGVRLDELSMGMSGDFEVAIEEGATLVRVGSALFEGLPT